MNLEHALKTGTLVEIEYFPEDGPATKPNTLIDYPYTNGNLTIYAPMIKGAVFPMQEHDTLNVMFMVDNADKTDKDIYNIQCKIEQRGYTNGIAVYKLSKMTEPEKVQRRGAFRLPIIKDFTMLVGEEKRVVHLTTNNISGTGVKSITNEKLEKGITVILNLNTDTEILQIPSTIVMSNQLPDSLNKFDTRLQFIIEKDLVAQKINAYLFKKQSEVIQKNIGPSGYSDLYYKVNEKDAYDPQKVEANRQSSLVVMIAYLITFIAMFAIFLAVPKDPAIIFKTLIRLNIVYNAWNYSYLMLGAILTGLNLPLCLFGIYLKHKYKLPEQLPIHVPLALCMLFNAVLFSYCLLNFGS
jgi:c-di-GMP-binding flagellar brake protein YcgR